MRLAALFSHPIQYFAPLLRAMGTHPGIQLTVYFCSHRGVVPLLDTGFARPIAWDIPLLEGYHHKFLPGFWQDSSDRWFVGPVNLSIVKVLAQGGYDAIWVNGYMGITNWLAFLTAWTRRIPILLRGESHLLNPRPARIRALKRMVLPALLRNVAGCLFIGTNNRAFYRYYGVPNDRLFFTPYTVDNSFFRRAAEQLAPKRQKIRAGWGIADHRPVILFVGKLVLRKQPLLLLEAYRRVRERHLCALLLAGDGPLRVQIENAVREKHVPDVVITGFLNQTEVPQAYVSGDILVLPSAHETWGLVVNEGMNFGLPVVVTDRVGCAPDLVRERWNGYIVAYDSVDSLEMALEELVANPDRCYAFGQRSLGIIRRWDIQQTVEGIVEAVRSVAR